MAARTLGRAGKTVTILEARERCGGRIHPLPSAEFGYPAEGGAEFVHGEAPITHRLKYQRCRFRERDGMWRMERSRGAIRPIPTPTAFTRS